jgi:hypothetical protein
VKRLIAWAGWIAFAGTSTLLAREPGAKAVYCVQGAKAGWSLQRFKPLIAVQGGTVFAEMTFDGSALRDVRVRRFFADSELTFNYTFDGAGRLMGLRGSVTVRTIPPPGMNTIDGEPLLFADWLGEADLTPGIDGRIPPHHVLYSREKDRIDNPEDAEKYIGRFFEAPVYSNVGAVPCGTMLKEAERMNAAQE